MQLFDGHNGTAAAIYTKENLLKNVLSAIPSQLNRDEWTAALPRAMVAGFVKTDKDFQVQGKSSIVDHSMCCMVNIWSNKVHIFVLLILALLTKFGLYRACILRLGAAFLTINQDNAYAFVHNSAFTCSFAYADIFVSHILASITSPLINKCLCYCYNCGFELFLTFNSANPINIIAIRRVGHVFNT